MNARTARAVVAAAWALFDGPPGAVVEVSLIAGREHTVLHARHLRDSRATDVMAFPYGEPDLFGEILVNRDMAREQARRRGRSALQEAMLYVAHGALHLLGFRDDDAAARRSMRAAEARVLQRVAGGKKIRRA
ncbi:MAG: rRNA maturation RNase YbeY [Planctomycetota bacterium]|nr:MAG: rRNA maturation RNase YbeY [Planctomycetota bacterium]